MKKRYALFIALFLIMVLVVFFVLAGQPNVTLTQPADGYNTTTISPVLFNCSAAASVNMDIVNITLYANWSVSGWAANESNTTAANNTAQYFNITVDREGHFVWNCYVCDKSNSLW